MIGENAKSIVAEDEDEAKSSNLENVEVKGKLITAEEAGIFPLTKATFIF